MQIAKFKFKKEKTKFKFNLIHNLGEFGLDIDEEFRVWVLLTKDFTQANFIRHLKSRNQEIICITKKKYFKTGKMDYTEYTEYLRRNGIKYEEQEFEDLDIYFTTYTRVTPVYKWMQSRAFDNDGGMQLDFKK